MSETMSSPTDWAKFYQQNLSGAADTDAATPASASTGMMMMTSNNLSSNPHGSAPPPISSTSNLSPRSEGRVSKPSHARSRRSRASRRTPTTLLNTDTTNFRAMVQQFTGGPNAPFASTPPPQSFGFALGAAQPGNRHAPNPNPNSNLGASLMFSQGYRLQNQPHQYQNQGYMISMSNGNNDNNNNNHGGAGGEGFFQRLGGNPRQQPPPPPVGSDGFLMEMNNVSSSRVLPSDSNENRGNGFMF